MRRDYKVRSLGREDIAASGLNARRLAELRGRWTFNVVDFIERTLAKELKGGLEIVIFDRISQTESPAFVTFGPTKLHVDRLVWNLAKFDNHDHSRFVLAHEIGHLVLHRNQAMAFSAQLTLEPTYYQEHESSEWQANIFAICFLIPPDLVDQLDNVDAIVELCRVPEQLAQEALAESRDIKRRKAQAYVIDDGKVCPTCGDFTLTSNGKCPSCEKLENPIFARARGD
jgi:hypothetical protein